MPKRVHIQIDLPADADEAEFRIQVEKLVFQIRKKSGSGKGVLSIASPIFPHDKERLHYVGLLNRLFKAGNLSAELHQEIKGRDLITELYASGTDFGMMFVYEPYIGFLARSGLLTPLDGLFPDIGRRFHDLGLRRCREGGNLYAVPLFISCRALFYRIDLLKKYGLQVPKTFDEMESAAAFILKAEKNPLLQGLALDLDPLNRFHLVQDLIWAQGEEMYQGSGPWSFNSAAWFKALKRLQSLKKLCSPEALTWNSHAALKPFLRGESIFCLGWTDIMRSIQEKGPAMRRNFAWAPHPTEELAVRRMVRLGGANLVIPRGTRHPKAAEKILSEFLNMKSQIQLLQFPSWPFPSQFDLLSQPKILRANPYYSEAEEFLKDGVLLEERGFFNGNFLNWRNAVNPEIASFPADEETLSRIENRLKPLLPQRPFHGLVAQAAAIIERCATGPLNVGKIASELKVTREHIMREFKRQTGSTVLQFIHTKQMKKAKEMLEFTHYHVGEVAQMLGYKDLSYFSQLFKKIIKKPPSKFKRAGF